VTVAAVPEVGPPRPLRPPRVSQRALANGLRVSVARRAGIPRFEVSLRIPTVLAGRADLAARQLVLAETLLSGTATATSVEISEAAQRLGGSLSTSADADWVVVSGSALSVSVVPFLRLLAEVVCEATFPAAEVALQRDRVVQEIVLARSQPETIARDALVARYFGRHAYGRGTPEPEAVAGVRPAALRAARDNRLLPSGSELVLVGDVAAPRALDAVESALGGWRGPARATSDHQLARPAPPAPGPTVIVDRPGAVQTNIRLAGPAVPRGHADFPPLMLANMIFGGYFTSRLVDNIRERRGYTYSPGSGVEHRQVASTFTVAADVGRDVTAAALVEILYELGRMVSTLADPAELEAARRYVQGTLAMAIQTQAGLTSYLATLASSGLGIEYLREYPRLLNQVTVEAVREVSGRYLAPTRLITVMVGDARIIRAGVEALVDVELQSRRESAG
jgi:zinc protease